MEPIRSRFSRLPTSDSKMARRFLMGIVGRKEAMSELRENEIARSKSHEEPTNSPPEPPKRPSRIQFSSSNDQVNTNDDQHMRQRRDDLPEKINKEFSPGLPKALSPRRRLTSIQTSQKPNIRTTAEPGRPMWRIASRIDANFQTTLSPPRSTRSFSIPAKLGANERSKAGIPSQKRESVFDRLYREGFRQRNAPNGEANAGSNVTAAPPQEFSRTLRSIHTSPSRKGARGQEEVCLSPIRNSRTPETSPPRNQRAQHELPTRLQPPVNSAGPQPVIKRRRRQGALSEDRRREPSLTKEDAKTWEKISAKTCELANSDVSHEGLSDLILQLIDEQSISPTAAVTRENVVSWKSLIASLADESQVQGEFDRLLFDHASKCVEEGRTQFRCQTNKPQVHHSSKKATECLEAVETLDQGSTSLETSADIANITDLQASASQGPVNHESVSILKGDPIDNVLQSFAVSPKKANLSISLQGSDQISLSLNPQLRKIAVNSALLRSSLGIVKPDSDNGRLLDPNDHSTIATLSSRSSLDPDEGDDGRSSVYEGSLLSLNSVREELCQEFAEHINSSERIEVHPVNNALFNCRSSLLGSWDQLSYCHITCQQNQGSSEFPDVKYRISSEISPESDARMVVNEVESNDSVIIYRADGLAEFLQASSDDPTVIEKRPKLHAETYRASDLKFIPPPQIQRPELLQPPPTSKPVSPTPPPSLPSVSQPSSLSTLKEGYKVFKVASITGSECSSRKIPTLSTSSPIKQQLVATPDYTLRRCTPEDTAREVAKYRKDLSELSYKYCCDGVITKAAVRRFKQEYRTIVASVRSRINARRDSMCQNSSKALRATLVQCVEQFIHIVDNRIFQRNWIDVLDKAGLLRMRADFVRYLFEVFPNDPSYQTKCHEAYKSARLFFLENRLQEKAEWVYLHMNYSNFLYMIGQTDLAQFIIEKLLSSLVVQRCGKDIKSKLQLNLQLYTGQQD